MKKLIEKLVLVFTHGDEINSLLKQKRINKLEAEFKAKRFELDLCKMHQPKSPGSEFAQHNCDHCKLEKKYQYLRDKVNNKSFSNAIALTTHYGDDNAK